MSDEIPIPDVSLPDLYRMLGERDVTISRLTAALQAIHAKQQDQTIKDTAPDIRYVAGDDS